MTLGQRCTEVMAAQDERHPVNFVCAGDLKLFKHSALKIPVVRLALVHLALKYHVEIGLSSKPKSGSSE